MRQPTLLTSLLILTCACQDMTPSTSTAPDKPTPQLITISTPEASRTPPVIRSAPPKPTPKPPQPIHPKKPPVLAWRYDASACMDIMEKAKARANVVTYGNKTDDLYDEFSLTELSPYRDALAMAPRDDFGTFEFEDGDGCMDYETQLTYIWRRATTPKYTKGFIVYHKRPTWMLDHFASTRNETDKFPPGTKITALYRGPFIVYEIDFHNTRRSFKNQLRRGLLRCFSPIKPAKI